MLGLTAVGNGVMAGFSGKRFCLSEPFLPHAWPIQYRITLEDDIVDIAATGNGVVALTNGTPYFITGTDPAALTPIRVDLAQACVNKNSVVDMGEYVLYAAPDGLVAVSGSTGEVVSRGLISVDQWNSDFRPTLIRAFRHEGTYVAFYNDGGTLGGWVYDPTSERSCVCNGHVYQTKCAAVLKTPSQGSFMSLRATRFASTEALQLARPLRSRQRRIRRLVR